jgi:hypothetical protein
MNKPHQQNNQDNNAGRQENNRNGFSFLAGFPGSTHVDNSP